MAESKDVIHCIPDARNTDIVSMLASQHSKCGAKHFNLEAFDREVLYKSVDLIGKGRFCMASAKWVIAHGRAEKS